MFVDSNGVDVVAPKFTVSLTVEAHSSQVNSTLVESNQPTNQYTNSKTIDQRKDNHHKRSEETTIRHNTRPHIQPCGSYPSSHPVELRWNLQSLSLHHSLTHSVLSSSAHIETAHLAGHINYLQPVILSATYSLRQSPTLERVACISLGRSLSLSLSLSSIHPSTHHSPIVMAQPRGESFSGAPTTTPNNNGKANEKGKLERHDKSKEQSVYASSILALLGQLIFEPFPTDIWLIVILRLRFVPGSPAARFQIGPSIEKLLSIPANLDGLTPLQAADCFLKSEEFYVERALRVACEMETRLRFHIKLNKTVLVENEIAPLFLNLQQIYAFNRKFYGELLKLRLHGDLVASVGQCVLQHCPFFRLYKEYIRDYRKSQQFFDLLVTKKKRFLEWLDLNELCSGYSLKQLLLGPTTRLPQYLIFLGAIVRSLDPTSPSAERILQAITAVSQVSDDIAFGLKDEVARKLVVIIQKRIFGGNCNLVSPHRFVVKHSDLKKIYNNSLFTGSAKIYLFVLMNDCLVYGTRPGKLLSGELKHVLPLIGMSIEDVNDDEKKKVKNGFKINSNTKSFVVCAINGPMKGSWMSALKEQIQSANASASTLQRGPEAADQFERYIKSKPSKSSHHDQESTRAANSSSTSTGTGTSTGTTVGTNHAVIQSSSAQVRTMIPIQKSSVAASTTGHDTSSSASASYASHPPPPPPNVSVASPPPPPRPAPPQPPQPPTPNAYTPSPSAYSSPPPPPPHFSSYSSPTYESDDSYSSNHDHSDPYDSYSSPPVAPPQLSEVVPSAAPTLEYDIPDAAYSVAPPPVPPSAPPMSPASTKSTSPKPVNLLTQIQQGKQLRSTQPQWVQILDPASGAYYYQHKVTGESTWEQPAEFVAANGNTSTSSHNTNGSSGGSGSGSGGGGGVFGGRMEDNLKATLDRYRAFVQDDADEVEEECPDDEWD